MRVALLRTYATELLRPNLEYEALLAGFSLDLYEGPYGVVHGEVQAGSGLLVHDPEITFVLARIEDVAPSWRRPVSLLTAEELEGALNEARSMVGAMIQTLRDGIGGLIVFGLLPSMDPPELGLVDGNVAESEALARRRLIHALSETLRERFSEVLFDDQSALATEWGTRRLFDLRLWHSSRFPFTKEGGQLFAQRLFRFVSRRVTTPVKCLVLDADNTLWGGIVGEDGPTGIALGPEYPGSAFVDWQRRLLAFRRRGLLLALCSKNDEASVFEVLDDHPHMVLKREHFSAMRINWEPKPKNIAELAAELNLGLDSFLFVDDSAHECHAVRTAHPSVRVVRAPENPLELIRCLEDEPGVEVLSLTSEDRRRAEMYEEEGKRRAVAQQSSSPEDYLRSLQMVMSFHEDDKAHVPRIAQLTQKTNQFNLTTRRYGEAEIEGFMGEEGARVFAFSLADVFGDSGLVGVAIGRGADAGVFELDSFLMSCRVIGRGAETAFLAEILARAEQAGFQRVRAAYLPTAKNGLVADFWTKNAFEETGEGRYEMDLSRRGELTQPPIEIRGI